MDAYLIFLFALPLVGLLYAIFLIAKAPTDLSAHPHLDTRHRPSGAHR